MPITKATQDVIEGITSTGSTTSRTLQDRFADVVNVKDFGAVGDGVTDDTAAIQAMIAVYGYAYFTNGTYKILTSTIDNALYFGELASLTVPAGNTLTITNSIESPRQWIFKGEGSYSLEHDSNSGEDSRQIHASWFGVFPTSSLQSDMAPNIQKAITSLGNTREGIVQFDVGNYQIQTSVLVNRGIKILGEGVRRTIFKINGDGFIPFTSNGEAAEFEEIQFEHITQLTTERVSPYIKIIHPNCAVRRVVAGRAFQSVVIDASNCTVNELGGFYNVAGSTGSSLVAVRGSKNNIHEVRSLSSSFGPYCLVHAGSSSIGGGTTATSAIMVSNVNNDSPARPFWIDGDNGNVNNVSIDNVIDNCGAVREGGIVSNLSGSWMINSIAIKGVIASSNVQPAFVCNQQSSGVTSNLVLSSFVATGSAGIGIKLIRSAGSLSNVTLDSTVNMRTRTIPIEKTGAINELVIMPGVENDTYAPIAWRTTISNDSVYVIDRYEDKFASKLVVIGNNASTFGSWRARAASGPALQALGTVTGIATTTGVLTGTTGIAGQITVSVDVGGKYYLENRSGSNITVVIEITG